MIPVYKFIIDYWNYYLLLEKKFLNTLDFVTLSEDNFETYSNEYINIMYTIEAELENVLKTFCGFKSDEYRTMKDYGKYIKENYHEILKMSVAVQGKSLILKPFDLSNNTLESSNVLFWWQAYDNIKHSRLNSRKDGNLKNTLYMLSALFLLEMYYMKRKLKGHDYEPINKSNIFEFIENDKEYGNNRKMIFKKIENNHQLL